MTAGTSIAAEVAAGLAEAGTATGSGPLVSTLRKRVTDTVGPWAAAASSTDYPVTVVQISKKVRDGLGLTDRRVKMLLIAATGEAPTKGDQVAIGVLPAAVTGSTEWARIGEVETLAPGGAALMYKATLEE